MKATARDYDILRRQIVSEKATYLSRFNSLLFEVAMDASKPQIKAAVENVFNVKVKRVATMIRKGKMKRFRNRIGRTATTKRAIVTLEPGNSIDFSAGM